MFIEYLLTLIPYFLQTLDTESHKNLGTAILLIFLDSIKYARQFRAEFNAIALI